MQQQPIEIVRARSSEQVSQFVRALARECGCLTSMSWFVHGMGGQPRSLYQNLPPSDDYEVLATASAMGKWMTALAPFVAGWGGVIWVRNCSALVEMFETIAEQSMAAIYAFDGARRDSLTDVAKRHLPELERAVVSDPMHFIYIVDEDSAESDDEVTEIVRWGPQCPSALSGLAHPDGN